MRNAWRATYVLGVLLGFFVGRVVGVRRAHVLRSLRRANVSRPERVADAMYRSLGQGVFELLWMAMRPRAALASWVGLGQDLRRLLRSDQGVVLATAHTGNWDLVACAAAAEGRLTVITKHLSMGWLDRFWQRTRARRGIHLVSAGDAVRASRSALARGEAVAMIIDQAPERQRGVFVMPYLDELAEVDLAPALLALRARVPLVLVVAERGARGKHHAKVLAHFAAPERPSRDWAERTMREATRALEAHVRARPAEWLWMHRRWKRATKDQGAPANRADRESVLA